ncbi:MAG: acyl-[acyl-carrier-protein] thioesterase [Mycobacteriaceae bacterium]
MTTEALSGLPEQGRIYSTRRRIRANDVDAERRLRLDGVARYLQDVAFDDLRDTGFVKSHPLWVLRRTVVDVLRPAHFDEEVRLRSWGSAFADRWCNKRVTVDGNRGALIETEGFWINVDATTGMPARLSEGLLACFPESAGGKRLRWRRWLHEHPPQGPTREFPLRNTDFDWFSHVNNAVYWHVVEEYLDQAPWLMAVPHRAVVEHLSPITRGERLDVAVRLDDTALTLWLIVGEKVRAMARVSPLD